MIPELKPELQQQLKKAEQVVAQIREQVNADCANLAEAWLAYLTEYIYSHTLFGEALQQGDNVTAAKHRLTAACHYVRASHKNRQLQKALERFKADV